MASNWKFRVQATLCNSVTTFHYQGRTVVSPYVGIDGTKQDGGSNEQLHDGNLAIGMGFTRFS